MLNFCKPKTKILTCVKLRFFDNFCIWQQNACHKPTHIIYVLEAHLILYTTVVVRSNMVQSPWTYEHSALIGSKSSPWGVSEVTV